MMKIIQFRWIILNMAEIPSQKGCRDQGSQTFYQRINPESPGSAVFHGGRPLLESGLERHRAAVEDGAAGSCRGLGFYFGTPHRLVPTLRFGMHAKTLCACVERIRMAETKTKSHARLLALSVEPFHAE